MYTSTHNDTYLLSLATTPTDANEHPNYFSQQSPNRQSPSLPIKSSHSASWTSFEKYHFTHCVVQQRPSPTTSLVHIRWAITSKQISFPPLASLLESSFPVLFFVLASRFRVMYQVVAVLVVIVQILGLASPICYTSSITSLHKF